MDTGLQGNNVKLNVVLAACLFGYGEVTAGELKRPNSWVSMDEQSSPYPAYVREYSGEMYREAVEAGLGVLRVYPRLGCF
jgi:hydroxymethylpyrimidine/phosphomethylpyrimidine kinase